MPAMPTLAPFAESAEDAEDAAQASKSRPLKPPLAVVESELAQLCQQLDGLRARLNAADARSASRAGESGAGLAALQRLQVHLFLTASQLLPVWRDLCRDNRKVDPVEVRLEQLSTLTGQILAAGLEDGLTPARCAVLAEDLQQHRVRSVVLLRALDAVADADSLHALAGLWTQESARLLRSRQQGRPLVMDNEDADPVGQPPR